MSEKGLFDKVVDSAKKFNIAGIPGNTIENFNLCGKPGLTIDKAVKNFTETGSVMLSKEECCSKKEKSEE
ncbi:MAG: hypothetical protein PHE06_12300 [Lachnospiraceae bacterium]|nr:hypothetical protein [Lachnospiraceae bacterium]MDD3796720.1 hypothetical protein [Lachnospiraceae bacterium]